MPEAAHHLRLYSAIAGLLLVLAACTLGTVEPPAEATAAMPQLDGCRAPEPVSGAGAGSFEDANLVVAGEIFRTYGPSADPVRDQVVGEVVTVDGLEVWLLDATTSVTVDDVRRPDAWRLWVGFAEDQLTVLCADGPDDITWPPIIDGS